MGSTFILGYNHLMTDMWRHASAKGLSVYSFLTSIPHYPRQLPTSTTYSCAKYPSSQLRLIYIHLVLHACLSAVGAVMELGSASYFVLCSSFCWQRGRRRRGTPPPTVLYQ